MNDVYYMSLALDQARKAEAMDEVPVGAVLATPSGRIIGQGFNQPISLNDPTAHAEIIALRMAARQENNYRLTGCILYVTIEPCLMCMGAIVHARINRLVFGARDPKWGAAGSLYDVASDSRLNHNLEVVGGVCLEQTQAIIRNFFKLKRSR